MGLDPRSLIHSPAGSSQFLATTDEAALGAHTKSCLRTEVFTCLGNYLGTECPGRRVGVELLKNPPHSFPKGLSRAALPPALCVSVPGASSPRRQSEWSWSVPFLLAGVWAYLTVVFIFVSLITNDAEYLFI